MKPNEKNEETTDGWKRRLSKSTLVRSLRRCLASPSQTSKRMAAGRSATNCCCSNGSLAGQESVFYRSVPVPFRSSLDWYLEEFSCADGTKGVRLVVEQEEEEEEEEEAEEEVEVEEEENIADGLIHSLGNCSDEVVQPLAVPFSTAELNSLTSVSTLATIERPKSLSINRSAFSASSPKKAGRRKRRSPNSARQSRRRQEPSRHCERSAKVGHSRYGLGPTTTAATETNRAQSESAVGGHKFKRAVSFDFSPSFQADGPLRLQLDETTSFNNTPAANDSPMTGNTPSGSGHTGLTPNLQDAGCSDEWTRFSKPLISPSVLQGVDVKTSGARARKVRSLSSKTKRSLASLFVRPARSPAGSQLKTAPLNVDIVDETDETPRQPLTLTTSSNSHSDNLAPISSTSDSSDLTAVRSGRPVGGQSSGRFKYPAGDSSGDNSGSAGSVGRVVVSPQCSADRGGVRAMVEMFEQIHKDELDGNGQYRPTQLSQQPTTPPIPPPRTKHRQRAGGNRDVVVKSPSSKLWLSRIKRSEQRRERASQVGRHWSCPSAGRQESAVRTAGCGNYDLLRLTPPEQRYVSSLAVTVNSPLRQSLAKSTSDDLGTPHSFSAVRSLFDDCELAAYQDEVANTYEDFSGVFDDDAPSTCSWRSSQPSVPASSSSCHQYLPPAKSLSVSSKQNGAPTSSLVSSNSCTSMSSQHPITCKLCRKPAVDGLPGKSCLCDGVQEGAGPNRWGCGDGGAARQSLVDELTDLFDRLNCDTISVDRFSLRQLDCLEVGLEDSYGKLGRQLFSRQVVGSRRATNGNSAPSDAAMASSLFNSGSSAALSSALSSEYGTPRAVVSPSSVATTDGDGYETAVEF